MLSSALKPIEKLPTYIPGFDSISDGGVPKQRVTLLTGTAGSGKTVFAMQFLASGIARGEAGVFVTFEETPDDLRRNVIGFDWNVPAWEDDGMFLFVDAAFDPADNNGDIVGNYDFGALLARIKHAVKTTGATRVTLDSIGAVFAQFPDAQSVRAEIYRIGRELKKLGVTVLLTTERSNDYGEIGRYGVEEFVADSVIVLRNVLEQERRRRTIEILKSRGAWHQKGEFPFTIVPDGGIIIVPLSASELQQPSSTVRVTSGIGQLDEMCNGGFFQDSLVLVSGATGAGKTLLVTQFLKGGFDSNERVLLFAFEESRQELGRNATGWGIDFDEMEAAGRLKIVAVYPETASPEEHLLHMQQSIEAFNPDRVAIDSISALERITSEKSFRELVIGISSFIKSRAIIGMFTASTDHVMGATAVADAHISTVTDSIILLRYVERRGQVLRGLTVLKMRGSMHDKSIKEFTIDGDGMTINEPFVDVTGILVGSSHGTAQA